MRTLIMVLGIVLFHVTMAEPLQDVIYKKDGSVLRGSLVEQDFANGRYKIRLTGGSVFSIDKDDIEKITKEPPVSTTANSGVNININNSPTINQSPQVQQTAYAPINQEPKQFNGSFYIGSMAHSFKAVTIYGETEDTYTGLNLGGQIHVNRHFGLYADVNIGSFSERKETDSFGNTTTLSGNDLADETYTSAQIAAILSTNLYQGWQFFTGLGAFTEAYSTDTDSVSASGSDFQLGMGYSWQTLQVVLRVNILNSSDYSDAMDSSTTGHLQLGFNF